MPNETGEEFCEDVFNLYTNYVEILISIAGVLFNLLNMLIFMSKKINVNSSNVNIKSSHYMYKYLALKSLCDCVFLFQNITYLMLECDQGNNYTDSTETDHCSYTSRLFRSNYYVKLFNLIFTYYFGFICQLSSMFCDVAATLDRYLLITRKSNNFSTKRISYKFFIGLILSYSCAFYIYKPFQLDIDAVNESHSGSESIIAYRFIPNKFTESKTSLVLDFVHSIVRDAVCVLILVVLNTVILFKLKEAFDRKKTIAFQMNTVVGNECTKGRRTGKHETAVSIAQPQNSNSNELRLTIMVVLIGLVNIVGHLPLIIHYIPIEGRKRIFGPCFQTIKHFFYYLSFTINIIFYYHFNMNYRRLFINLFVKSKLKDLAYNKVEVVEKTVYDRGADV